ncbi:MAG: hypothetical protein WBW73_15500 [Rhodoplanes sp.]
MTLGKLRELGVRSLAVTCECQHEAVLAVDRWPDALLVRAFAAIDLSFNPLSATTKL